MSQCRHVGSTYRLQLNGLGFAGATRLVPFLDELGIETCYLSPVTRARSGSTHGYDVTDPTVLDPALGTPAEFEALLAALAERNLAALLDIVPNHMAASTESPFFTDVLRSGRGSQYAAWFDVAWEEQGGKILLPVLDGALAEVVGRGELSVASDGDDPMLAYFDHRYPLAAGSDPDQPIEALLARQHYRLADWRDANTSVNYRRFFDINELIGIRQEDPAVFAATNRLVVELLADPRIAGVRIDHVDGLRDPGGYFDRLRAATAELSPAPVIVVEKIVEAAEELPDWPVEGTTGYEVGTAIVGLFVEEYGAGELRVATAAATGDLRTFAERAVDAKRRAIESLLPHQLAQIVAAARQALPQQSEEDLTSVFRELTAYLAVYRTYRQAGVTVRLDDLARVETAAHWARRSLSGRAVDALDDVVALLTGDLRPGTAGWRATAAWQQFSGPAAAKGVEDTALYDSGSLLAASDVGTEPDRPALSVPAFHAAMVERAYRSPLALSATSTHDSKRSHDVRCRLATISEVGDDWEATVEALDAELVAASGPAAVETPDAADRRYIYETVLGAWPVDGQVDEGFATRVRDCVVKSAREAKRHTSWLEPAASYEESLEALAATVCDGSNPAVRQLIEKAVAQIETAAATNSLAAALIKITAPGVPDIYQGDDAWFIRLVDPDNRVPLDGAAHRATLSTLPSVAAADASRAVGQLLEQWRDGRVKQLVVREALHARRERRELFAAAGYLPLEVAGPAEDHVVAFARVDAGRWFVTVVPRLTQTLVGPGRFAVGVDCWSDTVLTLPTESPTSYVDRLTGRRLDVSDGIVSVAAALETLPIALLDG
jgi:(1->4)-alpha-D-glucan 1-alpha-D-glucosylmutase